MRAHTILVVLLAAAGAVAPAVLHAEEQPDTAVAGVKWMRRVDAALERAEQAKKPILVFCYASLSSAAKHLETRIWSDAGVAKALERQFVPLLLDADAIDSAQSGSYAMSRLGIRTIPTHLVLDARGQILITERGVPAPDAAGMRTWIAARGRDVFAYYERIRASEAQPKKVDLKIELLQYRLELATRIGRMGGHLVVHPPPASARNRQVDDVIADAKTTAGKLERAKNPLAYRAWVVWSHASLVGGVDRAAALSRLDVILDDLARRSALECATVAFNTAYALFETDPAAARPYLARVIKLGRELDVYWKARVYEAYSHGRTGDRARARALYEAIVQEGPAENTWVQSAKKTLLQMAASEGRRKGR